MSLKTTSKRSNFTSIQGSQFVPIKDSKPMRVRTGYEKVISHLCGDPFAAIAKEDGEIVDINDELRIVKVKYKSGKEDFISFDKKFTNNSGHGFHVPQRMELNDFKVGDKVTQGDVIVYNKDFFLANRHDKQVDMKLGNPTLVAFIESDGNLEDASVISKSLSEQLEINVGKVVTLIISKDTNIYDCVKVGDSVRSTDILMTFDENPLTDTEREKYDDSFIDILNSVNRIKPKAGYTGVIADIHAYYKCPVSEMNPTLASRVREWVKSKNKKYKYTEGNHKFPESKPLRSDKVGSTFLTSETVIVKITIEQTFNAGDGDKIFVSSSNKSIISDVLTDPIMTEDGREVQLIHSAKGVDGRIVNSPYLVGVTSEVMKKLQQDVLDIWNK